ncbi:hypothetical protein Tco_0041148 [Tanacetum coccineum]
MPPLANLSFAGLDDSIYRSTANKTSVSVSQVETSTSQTSNTSVEMPRVESVRPSRVIIKDWVSDDEETFQSNDLQAIDKPSIKRIEFTNARNESVKPKQADKPRIITQNPKVDIRDWNGQMTQKLGLGFGFTKRACFVCGSMIPLVSCCGLLVFLLRLLSGGLYWCLMAGLGEKRGEELLRDVGARRNMLTGRGVSSRGSQPRMAFRVLMNPNSGIHNTMSQEDFDGKSGFVSSHGNYDGDHGEANQVCATSRVLDMIGLDSRTKSDLLSTVNPSNELLNAGDGSIYVADTVNDQYNVDVAATFRVLLTTIGDLDVLTKNIKAGPTGSIPMDTAINADVIPCVAGVSTLDPSKPKANFHSLPSENLCDGVFSEDGIIIASHIGKPIMLDSYTSTMCIESWGRSSFARCLIEVSADDVFKDTLTIGVPLIEDSGFSIETVRIEYEPKAAKSVQNTGASNVGNASKSSPSHVSSMSKNQPLKASFPTSSSRRSPIIEEGGNITMSNSYVALDDESEEEIENVYDESANLFNSTKTCESSSTFTVAAG